MNGHAFNASAGFDLANCGMDRTVVYSEEICALEKTRIRVSNEPEITRLGCCLATLSRERRELQADLASTVRSVGATPTSWPVWQTIMAVIFVLAGFGFTRMSFEPFDLDPELLWICSVGIACLCAYATAEFLEKTALNAVVLGLSIVLFVTSIVGLAMLASVRGDLFALHLQNLPNPGDAGSTTEKALAFYAAAAPKMRLFLTLLSLSLELAGGLALHQVRSSLKVRRSSQPSPESRRLEIVEREIGQTEALMSSLRNAPDAFELEFCRNLCIGLLAGAARHTRASRTWPTAVAFLAILAAGSTLRGQSIDVIEGLDYSATSKASGYGGSAAYSQNVQAAVRIIASLPAGSCVTVLAISDQSFSRPLVLMSGNIPNTPGRLREYDQIVATRNRLAVTLRQVAPSIKPEYQTTDILGFLIAAGMAFQNTPHMRHVLLIHSDMRQSATPLDIERAEVVPVAAALATVDRRHLFADLSGVDVFIYGVHAVGKDVAYWQSLRDFWTSYFQHCHANVRAFSMTREIPNLAETR